MARPRNRELRAGDQVRYTIPTPEIAAYLQRWGPGGISQAITAGLVLLMHGAQEPGGPPAPPPPTARFAQGTGPGENKKPSTPGSRGGAGREDRNDPGLPAQRPDDRAVKRLAISAFE